MAIKLEKVVKTYYDTLEEGKVLGRKCPKCGNVEWPPVYACNACGAYETEWYEMCGRGEIVELYMPTPLSSKPAYADLEPYAYAWVKCEEGPERNVMILNVTRQNEEYIRTHLPYPVHMQIVQRDGYKTCVFAIDPVDGHGNPISGPEFERIGIDHTKEDAAPAAAAAPVVSADPETVKKIIALAAAAYDKPAESLSASTVFATELKGPSVKFVGLCAQLEDEFDVMVNLTDAGAAKTIGALAALVDALVAGDSPETARAAAAAAATEAAPAGAEPVPDADPETLKRLIALVAETYDKPVESLSAATVFATELKAPSVKFVGLCAKLEDEFDVLVNLTDAGAAKTIGGLAALVDSLL